jgi:hypothetical protein
MAEITIYNTLKARLETIDFELTDKNTTWFDNAEDDSAIYAITDYQGCLLIRESGYGYPIMVDGVTRADIEYDRHKAYGMKCRWEEKI